jgi:hypothetical protein
MKYIFLLVLTICFWGEKSVAQAKISLGVKMGTSIPGIGLKSANPVMDGYKNQLASCFGFVLETGLNKNWSLLNELNYATISIRKNGSQVVPKSAYNNLNLTSYNFPDFMYANFESNIKIKYVEIPMMLKYYIRQNGKFNLFVNGGPFVGLLLYGNVKTSGTGKVYTDAAYTNPITPFPLNLNQEQNIQDRLEDFNYGFQGGIGVTFINNFGQLFANLNGTFGLNYMQQNKIDGENKSKEATLCIGYLIHLSK